MPFTNNMTISTTNIFFSSSTSELSFRTIFHYFLVQYKNSVESQHISYCPIPSRPDIRGVNQLNTIYTLSKKKRQTSSDTESPSKVKKIEKQDLILLSGSFLFTKIYTKRRLEILK